MGSRRTTRLLPAAAVVLVLVLTGCAADEDATGADAPTTAEPSSQGEDDGASASTTELTVDEGATGGRCMVPNAEVLATETTAFEGTVTSLEQGTATLDVDRWFTGEETEQVTVATPPEDLGPLVGAVQFEVGKTYLVSATDGRVSLCGFTAEKTPRLEAMYTEAFAS